MPLYIVPKILTKIQVDFVYLPTEQKLSLAFSGCRHLTRTPLEIFAVILLLTQVASYSRKVCLLIQK